MIEIVHKCASRDALDLLVSIVDAVGPKGRPVGIEISVKDTYDIPREDGYFR